MAIKKNSNLNSVICSLIRLEQVGADISSQSVNITYMDEDVVSFSLRETTYKKSIEDLRLIESRTTNKDIKSIKVH